MGTLREVYRLLSRNWRSLVGFELIYRALAVAALVPLLTLPLDALMSATGRYYLTWDTMWGFLLEPQVLAVLVVTVVILSALSVFDVSAILLILDQSREDVRATVGEAGSYAWRQLRRSFSHGNVLLPLYSLVLVPVLNVGVTMMVVRELSVPEYIQDHIVHNLVLSAGQFLVLLLAAYASMRLIYTLHAFALEERDFADAARRSWRLSRNHFWGDVWGIVGVQAVFSLAVFLVLALILAVGYYLAFDVLTQSVAVSLVVSVCLVATLVVGGVFAGLGTAIGYAAVSVRYWERVESLGEKIVDPEPIRSDSRHMRTSPLSIRGSVAFAVVVVVLVGASTWAIEYLQATPEVADDLVSPVVSDTVEVTGHRGASDDYPENTMIAFRAAAREGADWIELDVQQSKDGILYVAHDSNFLRVSGVDANSYDLTWEEIKQLDAGAYMGERFEGERYPMLSEVVAWAKVVGVNLNIELKPTGYETDFEHDVIRVLKNVGYEDHCIVTSQDYRTVLNLKMEDPDITTAYVMTIAYGDICRLRAADIYSIEETCCTRAMVAYVHANGKEVLSWTVNSEANMNSVMANGVDNIITNHVTLARRVVDETSEMSVAQAIFVQLVALVLGW